MLNLKKQDKSCKTSHGGYNGSLLKLTLFPAVLLALTLLAGFTLSQSPSSNSAKADTYVDVVTIGIPASCTLEDSEVTTAHTAMSLTNGSYTPDIGETAINVSCNDGYGYSIYAIGYSNNTDGNTNMIGVNTAQLIPTGTSTATGANAVSNWAMKLTATSGTYTPTILSDTNGSYASYHVVPSTATKVATYPDGMGLDNYSIVKSTYAVSISNSQPADTYVGQVKYSLVHPHFAGSDGLVNDILDLDHMQDFAGLSSSEKTAVLASMTTGQQYQLQDKRDGKSYYIAKLADGNVWMTQNLDHDIVTTANFYTPQNTDIKANWTASTATYATGTTTWDDTSTGYNVPQSYDPGDLCWNGTLDYDYGTTLSTGTIACGNDKHMHIGNYYSWTAAIAMNDSSSYTANNTDVDQSICPAGWTLPKSGTTQTGSGSFIYLWNQYSSTFNETTMMNSPLYYVYGGRWYGNSQVFGSGGRYWSSVVYSSGLAYELYFGVDGVVYPQVGDYRGYGDSVRCVLR